MIAAGGRYRCSGTIKESRFDGKTGLPGPCLQFVVAGATRPQRRRELSKMCAAVGEQPAHPLLRRTEDRGHRPRNLNRNGRRIHSSDRAERMTYPGYRPRSGLPGRIGPGRRLHPSSDSSSRARCHRGLERRRWQRCHEGRLAQLSLEVRHMPSRRSRLPPLRNPSVAQRRARKMLATTRPERDGASRYCPMTQYGRQHGTTSSDV